MTLPYHRASIRSGELGRAALLPTWQALPPTAAFRCCISALGAAPLPHLPHTEASQEHGRNVHAAKPAQGHPHQHKRSVRKMGLHCL